MGSAYPTIAADAVARYHRLRGRPVTFITGTDEHGEKIALAAAKRGMEPKAHCDDIVDSYKALWKDLDIAYDSFIRTTDAKHESLVRTVLERVWDRGDIYKADYEGWYCVDCEEYKDEADMDGDKNCPVHRKPCVERKEENYFFALSKYQAQLEALCSSPDFVQPESRRNEVLGWVKSGVRDFSISRAAVAWGIPVPRDPRQTVYVWFDALNGYLSGLLPEGHEEAAPEALAAAGWPASMHLIGKDILRFHAVYWPAMLLSAGLPPPQRVFGHGFLTKDGLKMGKSLGNVLEPTALVGAYGADAVRFYFLREIVFGQDGDFSEERFRNIVNASLANDVGNLLNRTLNLLKKNCGGEIPLDTAGIPADHPLRALAAEKVPAVAAAYERLRFDHAVDAALAISGRGNQYLEETAPWTAFKKGDEQRKADAAAVLAAVLEAVRVVAVLLSPVTPALSTRIYTQLGFSEQQAAALSWADTEWGTLRAGHATPQPQPVMQRLEGDFVTEPVPAAATAAPVGAKA
ncbi:methionine-tRNA mitochondrial [Micractinium conductrix]|uniref:methionine--tRNA ligase n=1 Tax=Micractinium conductrix TaxID=554055 RepID=A0A2P6V9M4_9CHLO|nr:methionine-tRNA mitochondrial [Micractinium conductrix]|eukprot:PSC70792.1 methionine-tRNA mitochondrial [Micractinium conductrix]